MVKVGMGILLTGHDVCCFLRFDVGSVDISSVSVELYVSVKDSSEDVSSDVAVVSSLESVPLYPSASALTVKRLALIEGVG